MTTFGDEAGRGGAAVLKVGRDRGDPRHGGRIVLAHVFSSDEADAPEVAAPVVELLADFLADASPSFRFGEDFGWVEGFLGEGQVFRDAWRSWRLAPGLVVGGCFSRRDVFLRDAGGFGPFSHVLPEEKEKPGRVRASRFSLRKCGGKVRRRSGGGFRFPSPGGR